MTSALYQAEMVRGFPGMKAQSNRFEDIVTGVTQAASGVQAAKFVTRASTTVERVCTVIANAADCAPRKLMGLVLRNAAQEPDAVARYDVLALMRVGYAYVIIEDNFQIGDPIFIRHTVTGGEVAGSVRATQDGTDCVEIPGVILSAGSAGGLGLIYFDLTCAAPSSLGALPVSPSNGVAGDILVHNGTGYVRLAKGTDGQVLKMVAGAVAWAADAT